MNNLNGAQSWSIVIFFYNEAGNIEKVCRQAIEFLLPYTESEKEIIFLDDGSTDKINETIQKITENKSYIKWIKHEKKLGIGACLKAGYNLAQMENICAVPGDGQFDLNELRAFRNVPSKTVISFFRTTHQQYFFFRRILTRSNKWINWIFFGFYLKDINWVKIYKKDSLKGIKLHSKSNFVESEIFYFLNRTKHVIIETPSKFLPRNFGESKSVSFSALIKNFTDIIRLLAVRFSVRKS